MRLERRSADRSAVRWERQRAWAAAIFTAGLLLFVWPFVRTPPLSIAESYAHLLGAWVAVVAALHAMSRSLGRERGPRGRRDG